MAKITRKFQRVFCGDVPANNVVAQFGSLKASSPTYSADPAVIQQLAAWGAGWSGAVVTNSAPALQDMNAMFYVLTRQMAYLMQTGIAEYDETTVYYTGSLAYDGAGNVYKCLADDTTNIAFSDETKWRLYKSDQRTSVNADYTVVYSDRLIVGTGSAPITVTIPQAVALNAGRELTIKSLLTGGELLKIDPSGASLIDGQSSITLSQYSSVTLRSNGVGYEII
jgi:hypothetical protein